MNRLGTAESVQVLRALGESTRWELMLRLGQAPASASGLQHELSISRQGIMKHLEILREAGLVSAERDGRAVVYQVAPERLGDIAAALDELSRGWDRRLAAIKRAAESRDSTAD
ncbi:helix-turn-helix transcriptional regulator [Brevibacterium luteolum]|uniref:ArsR/SmtB family transcription factor n=1 Tax=Brevibacterium luteolum TaxID=199591 RepID=UPI001C249D2B|nr:metalloregulator ArsR/SmtB family transcription factor [Brevibacterium luteolum]MBU8577758.1 metalloregulator ArsR/SmtB family transcription factor [Brevibacterium luteolum]